MVWTFPNSALMDALRIEEVIFTLDPVEEVRRQASGDSQSRDLAPTLWRAEITTARFWNSELVELQALRHTLDGSKQPLWLWDSRRKYPKADPDGTILGASSVTLTTVNGDNKRMSIQGLPGFYQLSFGDYVSFAYGANPSNQALHQVVELAGVIADSGGATGLFEVRPHVLPGWQAGDVVTLVKAPAMMKISPGTFDPRSGLQTGFATFSAIQHIRAT